MGERHSVADQRWYHIKQEWCGRHPCEPKGELNISQTRKKVHNTVLSNGYFSSYQGVLNSLNLTIQLKPQKCVVISPKLMYIHSQKDISIIKRKIHLKKPF